MIITATTATLIIEVGSSSTLEIAYTTTAVE